jgi:hypothetical protein
VVVLAVDHDCERLCRACGTVWVNEGTAIRLLGSIPVPPFGAAERQGPNVIQSRA